MKSKLLICLIILCVLFSLTTVSANDNQTEALSNSIDASAIELSQDKVISDSADYHPLSELNQLISENKDEITLEYDYKYDGTVIKLNKENKFTINGNNHIIDGIGDKFFMFYSKDVTVINNLTFQNGLDTTFDIASPVIFNNVNFINCTNEMPVPFINLNSSTQFDGCFFKDNGGSFSFLASRHNDYSIVFKNSIFSGGSFPEGLIVGDRTNLFVENCTFENFSSRVGTAISYKGWNLTVKKSKFLNLNARTTGGAIYAKFFPKVDIVGDSFLIEDCEFVNVSSLNNGGAIYYDLDSGSKFLLKTLNIVNTNFTNCKSKYGGAIADLGGILNIVNSSFENNYADFEGGAIYTSWASLNIINTTLSNNKASKNAGAIYFDKGKLSISQSSLLNNNLLNEADNTGRTIYAYDANIDFSNSIFDNGGISVYADFAVNYKLENITKNNDIFSLDNKNYIDSVESSGIKINLINNSTIVDELPSKFDLRDYGWVSPEKLQGDNDDCWAFAMAFSIESALLKSTGVLYDLSENYVQKLQLKYARNGDLRISSTGFDYSALGHALSWYGTLPTDAEYDDLGMVAGTDLSDSRIHLQDAMFIFSGKEDTVDLIKQAMLKYGSISVHYFMDNTSVDIPTTGENISIFDHGIHFISLMGWDDDTQEWTFKDSIGDFNHMRYDYPMLLKIDKYAIVPQNAAIAYIFENTNDYHVNYQTDLNGLTGFDGNYTYYSNEFTSKYDEFIGAVGTYFNEQGIDYSFDVYVNCNLVHTQNGISEFAGFKTIVLNKYIPIKTGDTFKVVFKSNCVPYQAYSRQHYVPGKSVVSADGESWRDLEPLNKTVCLKVYTLADDSPSNDTNGSDVGPIPVPIPVPDVKPTPSKKVPTFAKSKTNHIYTVYRAYDMKVICRSNVFNLKALIDLFNFNFTNGHLKVYIDGTLVFDGDVDDDLSKIIFEIIEKFLGKHEITVEFTDSDGKTHNYNETIIIE